jgi:hypothetical protein
MLQPEQSLPGSVDKRLLVQLDGDAADTAGQFALDRKRASKSGATGHVAVPGEG